MEAWKSLNEPEKSRWVENSQATTMVLKLNSMKWFSGENEKGGASVFEYEFQWIEYLVSQIVVDDPVTALHYNFFSSP